MNQSSLNFTVIKNHDFYINFNAINDWYQPIIGKNAAQVYLNLCLEADKIATSGIKFNQLSSFLNSCQTNLDAFNESRFKLEAMGLIKTYLDQNNNHFYFELITPLSFLNFIANQKFRHLLLRNLNSEQFQRLEYLYSKSIVPTNTVEVTKNFNQVFNDSDLNSVREFNFDQLVKNISFNTHQNVMIGEKVKELIEQNYKKYNFNLSEIEHCVYRSINKTSDNLYVVDYDLIKLNLDKYRHDMNNINLLSTVKVNRNSKMFFEQIDQEEIDPVFASYRSLSAEQYYSAIKKSPLTIEEKSIINTLKNVHCLDDCIINCMIDFSLNKTLGHLNRKYLVRMAETVNKLNLLDVKELFQYITRSWKKDVSNYGEFTKKVNSEELNKISAPVHEEKEVNADELFKLLNDAKLEIKNH
ncbi:MAG: hypothetical protein L3I91_01555 [Mycoplasma sp.]